MMTERTQVEDDGGVSMGLEDRHVFSIMHCIDMGE
jgi:hypothetical protein